MELSSWARFNQVWDKYTSPPYLKYLAIGWAGTSTVFSAFIATCVDKYGLWPGNWGDAGLEDLTSRVALLKATMAFTYRFAQVNYLERIANSKFVESTAHAAERLLERDDLANKSATLFLATGAIAYKGLEYVLLHAVGAERPGQVLTASVILSLAASPIAAKSARDERNLPTQIRDGSLKLKDRILEYVCREK